MKRYIATVVLFVTSASLLAGCGGGSGKSSVIPASLLAGCGGKVDRVSGGSAIVKIGSGHCVSADHGATVVASGDAVVAAHGNAVVVARGDSTVVVYNTDVRCSLKGSSLTVINAIKDDGMDTPILDSSCNPLLAPTP